MAICDSGYPKFGSIPRRYRDITITEKIDGTNGLICIERDGDDIDGPWVMRVRAGSRNRWLTLSDDNYGFARWVHENADTLIADLGEGLHYGEWWGSGIQRGYGLTNGEKRFSLFNTHRWGIPEMADFTTPSLTVVPTMYGNWPNSDIAIQVALDTLRTQGSFASKGFMNPEGVVIWHQQARRYEKVTLENDDIPKGLAK